MPPKGSRRARSSTSRGRTTARSKSSVRTRSKSSTRKASNKKKTTRKRSGTSRGRSKTPTNKRTPSRKSTSRKKSVTNRGRSKTPPRQRTASRKGTSRGRSKTPPRQRTASRKSTSRTKSHKTRTSPRGSRTRRGTSYKTVREESPTRERVVRRRRSARPIRRSRTPAEAKSYSPLSRSPSTSPDSGYRRISDLSVTGPSTNASYLEESKEENLERSYPSNTLGIISLGDSELRPVIQSNDDFTTFNWELHGTTPLAVAVQRADRVWYRGAIITLLVYHGRSGGATIEQLYSRIALNPDLQKLATDVELRAIRGLATRSVCHVLRLLLANGKLHPDDPLTLEAGGTGIPGAPSEGRIRFYEKTFGFEVVPGPLAQNTDLIPMQAPVSRVLSHCGKQAELPI